MKLLTTDHFAHTAVSITNIDTVFSAVGLSNKLKRFIKDLYAAQVALSIIPGSCCSLCERDPNFNLSTKLAPPLAMKRHVTFVCLGARRADQESAENDRFHVCVCSKFWT